MSLKEKILIADDSEMNQMLLEEILSDKYEYVMAKDGTEAVDILEKNDDIDLVMLDINMPKMDGFGVLEIMNLRHWISEVPVIIISSESDVDFIRRGYDLGASDYIEQTVRSDGRPPPCRKYAHVVCPPKAPCAPCGGAGLRA